MMSFSEPEISMMACPRCRGRLSGHGDRLVCGTCEASYEVRGRIADLLPWGDSALGPEWTGWREKLDLLQEWRRATWDGSASAEARQGEADHLAERFFAFLDLPRGIRVLEVGCGSAELRRYLPGRRYWGIDPELDIVVTAPEDAEPDLFLRAVGERLPLVDACFDAAILCETLDHCRDPAAVLREIRRVLRPGGILGILQNVQGPAEETPVPLHRRVRVELGRLRSRLAGKRLLDAADTKTCRFRREELLALIGSELPVVSSDECDQVVFVRAQRDGATARAEGSR